MSFSQLRKFFSIQRDGRVFLCCIKNAEIMACFKAPGRHTHRRTEVQHHAFYRSSRSFSFRHKMHPPRNRKLASGNTAGRISRSDTGAVTLTEWLSWSHNIVLLLSKSLFLYLSIRYENRPKCSYTLCMMEDTILFQCFRSWQSCEKRLLTSSCLSSHPPVHMEQLGSQWTDLHEI